MLKLKQELKKDIKYNEKGDMRLCLSDLAEFDIKNPKLRTFALAQLNPGEEVGLHKHVDECEYYYIISGTGIYDDGYSAVEVNPGTVTFTPSGESHGIKNTGDEMLEFIALIIRD